MKTIAKFLFELSSTNRMAVLRLIGRGEMNMVQLAHETFLANQETSNHLSQLLKSGLIKQDKNGYYHLTNFGRPVLSVLANLAFLYRNKDYFLDHDVSLLPFDFTVRLGDLSDEKGTDKVGNMTKLVSKGLKEANDYVWVMTDKFNLGGRKAWEKVVAKDLSIRLIIPQKVILHKQFQMFRKTLGSKIEIGLLDEVKMGIVITEKTTGVYFSDLKGRIDSNMGFGGETEGSRKWCHDLFLLFWGRTNRYP